MSSKKPPSPLRILLVEDSEHDQIAFERALTKSGMAYELILCRRAEEVSMMMQSSSVPFDIVVVDYNLPGINGLEAYKGLKPNPDLPPFVMLTGTGSEYLAVDALKAGMYDYIIKDPNQGYLRLLPLKLTDVKRRHKDRQARLKAKADQKKARSELEKMVARRTADLSKTVAALEQEIIERKSIEKALRASQQALRSLSLKIVETQENERRLMAKELHDSIGASLAAIKFAVEERLVSMRNEPPAETISLEKIVEHIQDTIKEVRRISTSLRPSMLDDLGLLATIRWFCGSSKEMYTDTRIGTRFELKEKDIPEFGKIVIYRVMQEALNNALKHSMADKVLVSLENADGCIRLCVADDGCGFDVEDKKNDTDPLTGYGLRGMVDRAEAVGGSLVIDSRPGQGTSVQLELPCDLRSTTVS
jgi:signal transduction histidine kinase